ncbi:MAG: nucleotide-binding protein, partial [Bacteroidia bacterium]
FNSSNLVRVNPFFDFRLITGDVDDNKFVNCAVTGSAHYLVTNDKHFNILKSTPFPKINVINIDEFWEILKQSS